MNTVKTNFTGLKTLMRQVEELPTVKVQVGLFADNAGRVADRGRIQDNPSLGYVHEFGMMIFHPKLNKTTIIPERSFIRMPLMTKLGTLVQSTNWLAIMAKQGVKRVLAHLGTLGEDVIQEAFATRGYGLWPNLSQTTINRKGSSAILIESAQMRKAVASRVV